MQGWGRPSPLLPTCSGLLGHSLSRQQLAWIMSVVACMQQLPHLAGPDHDLVEQCQQAQAPHLLPPLKWSLQQTSKKGQLEGCTGGLRARVRDSFAVINNRQSCNPQQNVHRTCTARFQLSGSLPYGWCCRKASSGCSLSTLASGVLGVGVPASKRLWSTLPVICRHVDTLCRGNGYVAPNSPQHTQDAGTR